VNGPSVLNQPSLLRFAQRELADYAPLGRVGSGRDLYPERASGNDDTLELGVGSGHRQSLELDDRKGPGAEAAVALASSAPGERAGERDAEGDHRQHEPGG
jgi:hypothetical protein